MLFRAPIDPVGFSEEFYQEEYKSGFTTDCPTSEELDKYKKANFQGTEKDYSSRIETITSIGVNSSARVLDYGASWGYGTWQLQQYGFQVTGYEISRPRARYAREMVGCEVVDEIGKIDGQFDVFFSCHVLEHIPQVSRVFELARRVVRPGGLFIAFTPNGSELRKAEDRLKYDRNWGGIHPIYLDERFYHKAFHGCPKLVASNPYRRDELSNWDRSSDMTLKLVGDELLFVAVL